VFFCDKKPAARLMAWLSAVAFVTQQGEMLMCALGAAAAVLNLGESHARERVQFAPIVG